MPRQFIDHVKNELMLRKTKQLAQNKKARYVAEQEHEHQSQGPHDKLFW